MIDDNSVHLNASGVAADRLNNLLTGIALKAGVMRARFEDPEGKSDLQELESLAIEAVGLLRQVVPSA